jgi:ketosteroid isomerase-like protein
MEEIAHSRAALTDALGAGDAALAAAAYAADGRLLSPAAELVRGRSEIEAYWRAGIAVGLSRLELQTLDLEVLGGVAIEVGRYVLELGPTTDRGKYLVLHRRQADGAWRRAVDVFNPDAPGAARRNSQEVEP